MAIGDIKICKCGNPFTQRWKGQSQCNICRARVVKNWRHRNKQKSNVSIHNYQKRARLNCNMTLSLYMSELLHAIKGRKYKDQSRIVNCDLDGPFLCDLWKIQSGLCAATGLPMVHQPRQLCSASVDRIDNTRGYFRDNVRLVCKWANLGRGSYTVDEFESIIKQIRQQVY